MTLDAGEEILEATLESILFASADGRYTVARARRSPGDAEVVLVGDLGGVSPGETLRVRGRFTDHAVYGRRFRAASVTPVLPSTAKGIARYLGSGLVPGIGPELAERLVARFGEHTLDVIAHESRRLREVPGIGKKRADAISETVRTRRAEAEALAFLHAVGVGPALARRIREALGEDAVAAIRHDPYRVAERVEGMGFLTADRIGRAQGIGPEDPRRAAGALLHVLGEAVDDGHVLLPRDVLLRNAGSLDVATPILEHALAELHARGAVVIEEEEDVYVPALHRAEVRVAAALHARTAAPATNPGAPAEIDPAAPLSDEQREAVEVSLRHRFCVLTGGPGTGKTTTVRSIVAAHRAVGRSIALAAPTGRAAKRLEEATGHPASTLHRLLEWNPSLRRFARDAENPVAADLLLVDEVSMLDLTLADKLLAAVAPTTTLVFVGDADQLPPVGPGPILRAILESGTAPVVRLTKVFRQAEASAIIRGAHAVLRGEPPAFSPPGGGTGGELYFIPAADPDTVRARVVATLERLRSTYGLDPRRDAFVLTPMRRGPLGTDELNRLLQEVLNPAPAGAAADAPPGALRVGDKVMQLRNDYERDVFNGDLGDVSRFEAGHLFVRFDGREVQYTREAADAVALAYASTVHKVQGSEFPAVVLVMHSSHHVLLSRALLYTAMTRARRVAVIIGEERAVRRALSNAAAYTTHARLEARLRQAASKAATTPS